MVTRAPHPRVALAQLCQMYYTAGDEATLMLRLRRADADAWSHAAVPGPPSTSTSTTTGRDGAPGALGGSGGGGGRGLLAYGGGEEDGLSGAWMGGGRGEWSGAGFSGWVGGGGVQATGSTAGRRSVCGRPPPRRTCARVHPAKLADHAAVPHSPVFPCPGGCCTPPSPSPAAVFVAVWIATWPNSNHGVHAHACTTMYRMHACTPSPEARASATSPCRITLRPHPPPPAAWRPPALPPAQSTPRPINPSTNCPTTYTARRLIL